MGLPGLDNRPDSPAARFFQSFGVGAETTVVGTGVVVVGTTVVVVDGGAVVVVLLDVGVAVVEVTPEVVVVTGSVVLDEEVVPPACRLAPQAVARAASPPMAPTRSKRRRLSSPCIRPTTLGVALARQPSTRRFPACTRRAGPCAGVYAFVFAGRYSTEDRSNVGTRRRRFNCAAFHSSDPSTFELLNTGGCSPRSASIVAAATTMV